MFEESKQLCSIILQIMWAAAPHVRSVESKFNIVRIWLDCTLPGATDFD